MVAAQTPGSASAGTAAACGDAEGAQHGGTVDGLVVSEVDRPTWSASTSRRCSPTRRGRRRRPRPRGPGTATVRVSKKVSLTSSTPPARARRRSRAAWSWARCAIRLQALGAVVDGVHRRDDGEQHLGGADVGGRLVAADVLLAGLQGQAVGRSALGVDRDADQATGQVPLETGGHRHEAGVRAAVEERYAEALRGADDDVGTHRAGRLEQGEREQVGGDDGEGVALVRGRRSAGAGRRTAPDGAGVLHQHAAERRPRAGRR